MPVHSFADVTGDGKNDRNDDEDRETRFHVGGSGKSGGSDQQVVGWGKTEWDKAREEGAVSEEAYQDAVKRGEVDADADFRFKVSFWKAPEGETYFSVNDGPLRTGDNPDDHAFLKAIRDERRCPDELVVQAQGKEPVVELVDKTSEEYKAPPKPKYVAFSGGGMSLGGSAKVEIDASAPVVKVEYEFVLDESAKTTKLQLNFHDGTKIVQKFNLTHTVQDVRMFMEQQKPLPFGTCFELRTAYDKKLLDDVNVTIQDGGLKGESLMQSLV